MKIVIDTNVMVSALKSRKGASRIIVDLIFRREVSMILSVPVLMEYEEVLKRPGMLPHLTSSDIDVFLDIIANRGIEQRVFFLWRPFLPDPDDDMLVELAMAGGASHIVTNNIRHLQPAESLGFQIATPGNFIAEFQKQ